MYQKIEKHERNRVLIIDDEKSNILALTNILSREYKVYVVIDSREAVETAERDLPDVILLDIIMPEMDGYGVIAALRKSEKTRDIPVIFITGLCDAESEEKGLILGAADYISKPFSPAIVRLRVANQMQLANQFKIIKALSATDELTGIFNRRGFDSRLSLEWNRAKRDKTSLSILILDIDNFKKYNDTYGHLQGDAALITVAKILSQTLKRAIDFSARWGGEEFAVLLPDTDADGALNVAEKIRKKIEEVQILCKNGDITNITVSIGINIYTSPENMSIQEFIDGADKALYSVKRTTKNMSHIYNSNNV
ncbi:MAG: diguanylate cyclase [Chitinivibrionia bacterium]|nr:diguanylate cyclase [Chitinivibrionia bacterium]